MCSPLPLTFYYRWDTLISGCSYQKDNGPDERFAYTRAIRARYARRLRDGCGGTTGPGASAALVGSDINRGARLERCEDGQRGACGIHGRSELDGGLRAIGDRHHEGTHFLGMTLVLA